MNNHGKSKSVLCVSHVRKRCSMVLIIVLVSGCATTTPSLTSTTPNPEKSRNIPGLFYSYYVGDYFEIYVNLPKNYDENRQKGYPVIYLLDADWYFDGSDVRLGNGGVKGIVTRLIEMGDIPETILVGIGYIYGENHRERDFLYPFDSCVDNSGGGEKFYTFLENELIPLIDVTFNTDTSERTLIGHSYGGYFTLYALLKYRPSHILFTNFIAVSPVTSYHDNYILYREEVMNRYVDGYLPLTLYMTGGSQESTAAQMSIIDMAERLTSRNYRGFHFLYKKYYRLDNGTILGLSIEDGLKWIFLKDEGDKDSSILLSRQLQQFIPDERI